MSTLEQMRFLYLKDKNTYEKTMDIWSDNAPEINAKIRDGLPLNAKEQETIDVINNLTFHVYTPADFIGMHVFRRIKTIDFMLRPFVNIPTYVSTDASEKCIDEDYIIEEFGNFKCCIEIPDGIPYLWFNPSIFDNSCNVLQINGEVLIPPCTLRYIEKKNEVYYFRVINVHEL
jgi:hypothetical protein